jgi:hypothetical protein
MNNDRELLEALLAGKVIRTTDGTSAIVFHKYGERRCLR